MSLETLFRWSGLSLLLGALLAASGALLTIGSLANPFDPVWRAAGLLGLLGWLLLAMGLPGLYARQAARARKLGLVGFIIFFFGGMVAGMGQNTIYGFILPWLSAQADTRPVLEQGTPALDAFFVSGELLLVIGAVLLGIATMRAGVLNRWMGALLIAGGMVRLLGQAVLPGFTGVVGIILLFAAPGP